MPEIRNAQGERIDHVHTPGTADRNELVIVGHGVTSHHDRPYFVQLCEAFQEEGYATLRFSYAGNGDSEGRFEEATITKEIEDLGAVLDAFPDTQPIYVGHSMGGAVGVLRATIDPRIEALISLAGMVHVQAFMERVFGHLTPDRDLMLGREGCPLTSAFLADAAQVGSVLETGSQLRLPFLLVHGTEDELVPCDDSRELHAANGTTDLVELDGVDHRFSDHIDDMVEAVVSWTLAQETTTWWKPSSPGRSPSASIRSIRRPSLMKTPEQRLTDLEIRYTEQEDTLQKLDEVVRLQQAQIEQLESALRHYASRVQAMGGTVTERSLEDDKPPHY